MFLATIINQQTITMSEEKKTRRTTPQVIIDQVSDLKMDELLAVQAAVNAELLVRKQQRQAELQLLEGVV